MKNIIGEKPSDPLVGRLKASVEFVGERHLRDKDVLDIGCGYGWFELNALNRGAKSVVGMEITQKDLETAASSLKDERLEFRVGTAIDIPAEDASADTIVSWEVLEHIPKGREQTMFDEAFRVLRPGGSFFLSTPFASVPARLGDPAWLLIGHRHYTLEQIESFARHAGFEVKTLEVRGGWWDWLGILNMYVSKWVLRREPVFRSFFSQKTTKEYRQQGFMTIFFHAVKPAMPQSPTPSNALNETYSFDISVVIPTYNSKSTLLKTLASLERSSFAKDRFEVIVIDDGSADATAAAVNEFQKTTKMNLVFHRRDTCGGPGIARAEGNALAKGRVIACTDADCVVSEQWLSTIAHAMLTEGYALVAGDIETDELLLFPWKSAPAGCLAVTANLAFDRARLGTLTADKRIEGYIGSDTDIVIQSERQGIPLKKIEHMEVFHPHNRFSWKKILKKAFSRKNEVLMHKIHGEEYLKWQVMHPLFKPAFFGRVSIIFVLFLAITAGAAAAFFTAPLITAVTAAVLLSAFALVYLGFLYRFSVTYIPSGHEPNVSVRDRLISFAALFLYVPAFIAGRVYGSVKFRHLFL